MMYEQLALGGRPVVGFGLTETPVAPTKTPSPWTVALVTTVVGTAAGWALDEAAHHARKRRRR